MSATILVADDDRAIRTVLNQALARLGHDVRLTGNAATLWRWIADGDGDLVITDVIMPDENGLDLVIANKNAPRQCVLSGPACEVQRSKACFAARQIATHPISVSRAFHSRLVADAASNSHPVAALSCRLHQYPACVGRGLRRAGPFSFSAFGARPNLGPLAWIRRS